MKKLVFLSAFLFLLGCSHPETTEKIETHDNFKQHSEKPFQTKNTLNEIAPLPLPKPKAKKNSVPESKMLNVVLLKQNPELKYGCEVTSLAMVLQYAGVKVTKMELFEKISKEQDPLIKNPNGDILKWGNPNEGFVGDMTGRQAGYAVFDKPMIQLIEQYLPGRSVNLTSKPFEDILFHLSEGYPIVVWTTGDFRLPDRWESWYHGSKRIRTPLDLHAVVLVGYDKQNVYLNDPLSEKKQVSVPKTKFIASWKALQSRAVSFKSSTSNFDIP